MKRLEKMIREDLLKTRGQLCVSLYIPEGSDRQRCDDLKELTVEASKYLQGLYNKSSELEAFLRPLAKINKAHISHFKGSLGVFRTEDGLKIVEIPVEVEKECFVSNHYHIKPLLNWLQDEARYFCVEFGKELATIYQGDFKSMEVLAEVEIVDDPNEMAKKIDLEIFSMEDAADTALFLSGNEREARSFEELSAHNRIDPSVLSREAYGGETDKLRQMLEERLRHRSLKKIRKSLVDYSFALMNGRAEADLEKIIQAAKQGRVKKLIVSKDDKIWGRFDAAGNNANRVNEQINYEDDDLLDSISEKVMETGGEVVIAKRKDLPKGKAALAILKGAA